MIKIEKIEHSQQQPQLKHQFVRVESRIKEEDVEVIDINTTGLTNIIKESNKANLSKELSKYSSISKNNLKSAYRSKLRIEPYQKRKGQSLTSQLIKNRTKILLQQSFQNQYFFAQSQDSSDQKPYWFPIQQIIFPKYINNNIFEIICSPISKKYSNQKYTIKLIDDQNHILFAKCEQSKGQFIYKQNNLPILEMKHKKCDKKQCRKLQIIVPQNQISNQHFKNYEIVHQLKTMKSSYSKIIYSSLYSMPNQNSETSIKSTAISSKIQNNTEHNNIYLYSQQFQLQHTQLSMINTIIINNLVNNRQQVCVIYSKNDRIYLQVNHNLNTLNNHIFILLAVSRIDAIKKFCNN